MSTLRRNRCPPRRTGHRPSFVLVPPVTKVGEIAAAAIRPTWPMHNLWLPCPRRRRSSPPPRNTDEWRDHARFQAARL